jgi:tetratricopeptide (TPR) repeat protein
MKIHPLLMCLMGLAAGFAAENAAAGGSAPSAGERLGTVSFETSCAPSVRARFSRGVALLHDFWYQEAERQFEDIAKADPSCSMAHWGVAMSVFHQIWDRPDEGTMAHGRKELQAARAHPAKTAREREYIAASSTFYQPGQQGYQPRVEAYAAAMGALYKHNPGDVDAGSFYALALLAAQAPGDTSVAPNRNAMAVLSPLFAKYPDHPGVVHYIIHACDTPALASDGLSAAKHYGEIASSAPHAVHMPGHIFARLGMWQADIDSNLESVTASHAAEARKQSGAMDQFHSDDFLVYAYLQSGQEAKAKAVLADSAAAIAHFETMPDMGDHYMTGMFPYYRAKFPVFYYLEMRDWNAAAALDPAAGAPPPSLSLIYWARAIAAGHLHQAQLAKDTLAEYEALTEKIKKGKSAYEVESTAARIVRGEITAWVAYAEGNSDSALSAMRESADLQDKVGQGEVDIPAREMLADMLLELNRPQDALVEYQRALTLSPNRFNGLFNAGMAAEAAGDKTQAQSYYAALLKQTDNGSQSARPEFDHVKGAVATAGLAVK